MLLRRTPAPPLDALIECLWHVEREAKPHARERTLPAGRVDLVIHLASEHITRYADVHDPRGQHLPAMLASGAGTRYFVIDTSRPSLAVGAHFRAGAAAALLGLPAGELVERHAALEDLWGWQARRLRERLLAAASPQQRLDCLEAALRERLDPLALPDAAVRQALHRLHATHGDTRIAALHEASGLAASRFIARFSAAVGLTPKRYARVLRFRHVLQQAAGGRSEGWAELAAAGGYHDQAHLVHEFRALSGLNPSQYRPAAPDQPSHVAVAE